MLLAVILLTVFSSLSVQVTAESHAITFSNNCGSGTPKLVQGGKVLNPDGKAYTVNGPLNSAIAFLDNGSCSIDGNGCPTVELNLANTGNGANSVDISLIDGHTYTDAVGFEYTGSCAGQGASCGDADCNTAFHVPEDTCVQVSCPSTDAGVNIIFCGVETSFTESNKTGSPCNGTSSSSNGTVSDASNSTSGVSTSTSGVNGSTSGVSSSSDPASSSSSSTSAISSAMI